MFSTRTPCLTLSKALLLVLLVTLLLLGVAHAQNDTALTNPIGVDAFVPNAVRWLQDTFKIIARTRIFPAMEKIAMLLLLAGFVMGFIKHWPARNMTAIFRNVIMSVLAGALIHAATTNAGAAGTLYRAPMDVWATVYGRSTNAVQGEFQAGVIQDTKNLAEAMNSFMAAATLSAAHISVTGTMNSMTGGLANGVASSATSAIASTVVQTVNDRIKGQMLTMQWIYQIGYLLLMGFFMAFAGVIYLSGLSVIIGMLALPVALAFWANGHSGGVKLITMTWVTAIVTVGLLPHMMLMVTNMALKQPTAYILSQVQPLTAQANADIAQYTAVAQACADQNNAVPVVGGLINAGCQGMNDFTSGLASIGGAVLHIGLGMLVMVMTLLVALGVGAAIIRGLPSLIGGLLGANAGGSAPAMSVAGATRSVSQAGATVTAVTGPIKAAGGGVARTVARGAARKAA